MSPNPEHTSHVILRSFTYPTLPQEPYTTRMIRLLPNKDKSAPIQCELFNYDLSETGGGAHLYQALSYVWGSEEKPESIILNGCTFHVTTNLHSALLHLRNRQLERTLWIDAICINQDEEDQGHEKSKQIPLMRMIYAQAERVIVWLGDATENGDKALDGIRCLAEEQYTASTLNTSENYDACLRLLQQDWFSRIWVLQEVGVARCVNIMCGSVSINGHIFCEGLTRLRLSPNLRSRIGPVAYLIRGALYRPTYEFGSRGPIFIGELIGMYHHHNATKQHDKVYALLGLCADPITAVREPNYNLPWKEVFKEVTNSLFPECSVETWNEIGTVVIKGKGWILGHVDSVEEHFPEFGKQKIEVLFNNTAESLGIIDRWETNWKPQASAELIQDGDIICLLKGASKPSVIRLCKDHFTIVTPAVTPQKRQQKESPVAISQERYSTSGLCDILLTWKTSLAKTNRKEKSEIMFPLIKTPDFREEPFEARKRLKHTTLVVIDIALRILERGMPTTKVIEQLLRQSGTNDQIIKELVRVVKNEDEPSTVTLSRDPLRDQGNNLRIPEETIIAAIIDAGSYGFIIVELFLQYQGMNLPVSEEVVKAVAGSEYGGNKTIETLFRYRGENLPVSEEVVRAAAGNNRQYGPEILEILFRHRGKNLPVSEKVVRAAAGNNGEYGPEILEILIQKGKGLPVSEEVVRAAAGNNGHYGPKILGILIQQGKSLPVSEEVVRAAAGNDGHYGPQILKVLFRHRGENLPVSEEVVKIAAGKSRYGPQILEVLFRHRENLPVSEEVVKIAAANYRHYGPQILKVLFRHRENLPVSEEVVKIAAGKSRPQILEILFRHRGKNLPVSEKVVGAAAGNKIYGPEILEILFQHRGENLPVSEEVVKIATGNKGKYGPDILKVLFHHRGNYLRETGLAPDP